VRVGEVPIGFEGAPIGLDGFGDASEFLQEHGEIEVREGIIGRLCCGSPIVRLRQGVLPGVVVETAEVDVGVGVMGVELERAAVGVARLDRIHRLELEAQLVPVAGVERLLRLARHGGRAARDGARPGREVGHREVELDLVGLWAPRRAVVPHHDAARLGGDAQLGQGAATRQLLTQATQRGADAARRDARGDQPLRRAEDHQVLKGEEQLAARAVLRDRPDIVIADEIASRMGAFALARSLRDDAVPFTGVIVILLERVADVWLASWSGADAWFVKPADPFAVADRVWELLEERGRIPQEERV